MQNFVDYVLRDHWRSSPYVLNLSTSDVHDLLHLSAHNP